MSAALAPLGALVAVTKGPSPLWYLTRGTGIVSLVLLSATTVLGITQVSRWSSPRWPRFVTQGLHRNLSLSMLGLLAVHIVTAELDTFAPVGWAAVIVPFASRYRPVWLGLGTLAFDMLLALVATSLLRARIGLRAWRAVHWAAYLSWPVALAHGLGTGTDPRLHWVEWLTAGCAGAVAAAGAWRLARGWPGSAPRRLALGAVGTASLVVIAGWASWGPLRPGWAARAGTPLALLASSRPATPVAPGTAGGGDRSAAGAGQARPSSGQASATLPPAPFSATLVGTLSQSSSATTGQTTVMLQAVLSGGAKGSLTVALYGQAVAGGVSLSSSSVSLGPSGAPSQYQGQVTALQGGALVASVTTGGGQAMRLDVQLGSTAQGPVQGSLTALPAGGDGGRSSYGGDDGAGAGGYGQ